MQHAILYNAFVCFMITLFNWVAAGALLREGKERSFARWMGLAWACAAMLWFAAGWRLLAYFGFRATGRGVFFRLDRGLFLADETFLAGQVVCLAAAYGRQAFGDRLGKAASRAAVAAAATSMAVFLALLFLEGVTATVHTEWASEHEIPRDAFLAFLPGYALSLLLTVCAIIHELWRRWRGAAPTRLVLPISTAVILYAAAGIADVRGAWAGWPLLLIRLTYLLTALMVYWVARPADMSLRLVRSGRTA